MIKLFEVSGFKNFNEKITLDFSDVRDYRFNTDCITDNLISKLIVYGKNSVGKSNLGLAVFDIVSHLTSNNITPGIYNYYLNVANPNDYAEFHYIFKFDKQIIDYLYRKDEKQNLIFEKLCLNQNMLFEYDYKTRDGDIEGIKKIVPTLNWVFQGTDSILKYVINNSVMDDLHPLRQMMHFVSNMLWFRSLDENRYIGYKNKSDDYFDFIFADDNLNEFESFLHDSGIEENLVVKKDNDGIRRLYFDTNKSLPFFAVASSGTKALYTFYYWYKTAKDVSFMFIDEFDSFYHFELAESIVLMLEKMKNTQVALTSHNTNLLTNRIMRPDCYFILTKNKLTSFANATDRELREGHNLEKLYMSGEFNE
ncbi:ATP-binding protein [Tissierella sp. Yu-01]|uniref:AAA family ATPase n=1 Tax=Tissierella sp. Yu-01 TaxID=3035694 RepID=UPI00240D02E7|nr:ATP-binding protein [Tissierella sp. Yu-01]WFA07922.1 ATP-binding protein [Tissierella sp. Yu-01]